MDPMTGEVRPVQEQPAAPSASVPPQKYASPASPFVPLLVLALAFAGWAVFQTVMLIREANTLTALRTGQDQQMQNAAKLRQELDSVARDTAKLADNGNVSAKLIVDELRRRGITINPQSPPSQPVPPQTVPAK